MSDPRRPAPKLTIEQALAAAANEVEEMGCTCAAERRRSGHSRDCVGARSADRYRLVLRTARALDKPKAD